MKPTERHRVPGTIESVQAPYNDDHGFISTWVFVNFDGSRQGFGGLVLDEALAEDYLRDSIRAI